MGLKEGRVRFLAVPYFTIADFVLFSRVYARANRVEIKST